MRNLMICLSLIAMLIVGCASNSYLPFYNTSNWNKFYTGGDGSSTEKAIVINSNEEKRTIEAENHYLTNILAQNGNTYQILNRSQYGVGGRIYDKIELIINEKTPQEYHFDITKPVGQSMQP